MKKLIGILLLFWANGIFAQTPSNDQCSNATPIAICQTNSASSGFRNATVATGEFLPYNGLLNGNLITKTIFFRLEISTARRIDLRVKGLPASATDDHAGFAIYHANDCNSLNNSTLIGVYPDLNATARDLNLSAGTYYVQVFANQFFQNEVSVEITPKSISSYDLPTSPYSVSPLQSTNWIDIDNLSLPCGANAPAGFGRTFWAKVEVPAGKFAMPFKIWINNYTGNSYMILRKNSPTAEPILETTDKSIFQCGLSEGVYYLQIFFPTQASGIFSLQNQIVLKTTDVLAGTSFTNSIPLTINQTQTVSMTCQTTYPQSSFFSVNIPQNGELKMAIYANQTGNFQLFDANESPVSSSKSIANGSVLSYCDLPAGSYYAQLSFFSTVSSYTIYPSHQISSLGGRSFSNALVLQDNISQTVNLSCQPLSSLSLCGGTFEKHSFTSVYFSENGEELKWTISNLVGTAVFQLFDHQQNPIGTCQTVTQGKTLSYCGLPEGNYYARLSFPASTQVYTIRRNEYNNLTGDKIIQPAKLYENGNLKMSLLRTRCLTLDANEDHFSSLYTKSLIAKIEIPDGKYGNPLQIFLKPQVGNFGTKGKVLYRMFKGSLNGELVTNKAGLSLISADQGSISSEYCELEAGTYYVQALFEDEADYTVSLEAKGEISEKHNRHTANNPYQTNRPIRDDGSDTIQVADYLACSPPIGNITCALPYCSTFLQWTQGTAKIVTVNILPSDLQYRIWRVQNGGNCHYIDLVTTCGNGSAVVGAGTYMMQVYSPTPIGLPVLAMITVVLTSPENGSPVIVCPRIALGANRQVLDTLNFDDRLDYITISSNDPNFANRPCSQEVSLVGFDLADPSFVQFDYDLNFNLRLFRGKDTTDLKPENEVPAQTKPQEFCDLPAGKYLMALYSGFRNTEKIVKISTSPVLTSKAPTLAQAQTRTNDFGLNPKNVVLEDQIGCKNPERAVWFTWTTDQAGSFSLKGNYQVYDPSKFRFFLYYTEGNAFVTTGLQIFGVCEYDINAHLFNTPCHARRYYLKVLAPQASNYSPSIKADFLPSASAMRGNYMNNAQEISFSGAGNFSAHISDIACHDLSPTDYNENNPNDPFITGLSAYKSTWFKVRNQTEGQNMDISLNLLHGLSNLQFIRYRVLKANITGTGVIGEGASLTSINGTSHLGCFTNPYYYVQVITNQAAQGWLQLNATVTANNGICPSLSPCDMVRTTEWTGTTNGDWQNPTNWTNGVPNINTSVIISQSPNIPNINTTVWAANITLRSALIIEEKGKLTLNGNWTNQSSQIEFGGTVAFVGCQKQWIKGSLTRFTNLEVDNAQNIELEVPTEIQKLLNLKTGNLLSNGKLTLVSNPSTSAMVVQKEDGSNRVIGAANVQRYIFGTPNTWVSGSYAHPYGYHYLSSPTQNSSPVSVFGSGLVCNPNYNTASEPAYTSPFPNLFVYNENRAGFSRGSVIRYSAFTAGWEVPNCQEFMIPAKGYNANIAHRSTLTFAGDLNNGVQSISLSRGTTGEERGWNLIGNPYPAPILWSKLFQYGNNATFLDDAIYMRIALGKETGTWASYVNGIGTNGGSDTLAIGQGFFVRLKDNFSLENLQMDNSVRVGNQTILQTRAGGRIEQAPKKEGLLKIALKNNKQSDETVVYFQHSATEKFDQAFDALKILNTDDAFQATTEHSRLNLYTQSQDKYLAINALPVFEANNSSAVPLLFEISESGNYELKTTELAYFPKNSKVYLEDRVKNTWTELTENSQYSFSAQAGQHTGRFVLHFSEKSLVTPENNLWVYPNPTTTDLKMRFTNSSEGSIQIRLYTPQGKEILHQTQTKKLGTWEGVLLLTDLPKGLYILEIRTLDQKFTQKILKQ